MRTDSTVEYSLEKLASLLGVELEGDPEAIVTSLATLANAGPGDLSFYHNSQYHSELLNTNATAVILHPDSQDKCPVNVLLSGQPYIIYAKASQLFKLGQELPQGIHPSAVIHESAKIHKTAVIGAHVVVAENVIIDGSVQIGPNCIISANCQIGEESILHGNISLYDNVLIGKNVIIHASVVIGSDGFGYAWDGKQYLKIAQLGSVKIGDNVEIGASSSIDRGALDDTVIEDGVKIDNQVQIAHNVRVGANTVICGCSAIAGSSTIGKNCTIAGGVGIINHITIADEVTITAMSLVNQSINEKGFYSSGTGLSDTQRWKKNAVRFKELDEMSKRLKKIEQSQNQDR